MMNTTTDTVHMGVQINSVQSQRITGMRLYTGYMEVRHNGDYLYRTYSPITRTCEKDALADAREMYHDSND